MVLESTIICCDNSNYQRNGDYLPTRLGAQTEAINLISLSKMRSHPENNIALMTIANTVEVLATLTSDIGRIAMKMGKVMPNGDINLLTGLRIAHLVLKHRQGKNHRMRIVVFVGSPLNSDIEEDLVNLAKRLKKEKVQVDIVSFGGHGNEEILKKFLESLNGKDGTGSHMVDIPRGTEIMDLLIHSPIVLGEDGIDALGLSSAYEYGVDPNEDPDLALALRLSMEEERQRRDVERQRQETENQEENQAKSPTTGNNNDSIVYNFENMTEEQQIAYAMQMSLQQEPNSTSKSKTDENVPNSKNQEDSDASSPTEATSSCCSTCRKNKDKKKKK